MIKSLIDQNIENRRMLCCGEYSKNETHVSFTYVHGVSKTPTKSIAQRVIAEKVSYEF